MPVPARFTLIAAPATSIAAPAIKVKRVLADSRITKVARAVSAAFRRREHKRAQGSWKIPRGERRSARLQWRRDAGLLEVDDTTQTCPPWLDRSDHQPEPGPSPPRDAARTLVAAPGAPSPLGSAAAA